MTSLANIVERLLASGAKTSRIRLLAYVAAGCLVVCTGFSAALSSMEAEAGFPFDVIDSAGRSVTIPRKPETIIAMGHVAAAQLASIGVRAAAGSITPDFMVELPIYRDAARAFVRVQNADGSADYEKVAAFNADLILNWSTADAEALAPILPSMTLIEARSLDRVETDLRQLARILGVAPKAEAAIRSFHDRVAAYGKAAPRNRSVMIVYVLTPKRFLIATRRNAACQIISALADCISGSPASSATWVHSTAETLLAADPDVILLGLAPGKTAISNADIAASQPLWRELKAVKSGHVVTYDGYQALTGWGLPTLSRALDIAAPGIYPETFSEPLTDAQIVSILGG